MRYLCLIYTDPSGETDATPDDPGFAESMKPWFEFNAAGEAAGVLEGGEALQPVATATTIRSKDGEVLTTDGPFAETKDVLGGYYVLDCADLDEAISWASRIPAVQWGASVEVRPIRPTR